MFVKQTNSAWVVSLAANCPLMVLVKLDSEGSILEVEARS